MGPTGLCGGGWKEEGEYWERGGERQHDQMQSCCLSAGHEPTMSSDKHVYANVYTKQIGQNHR